MTRTPSSRRNRACTNSHWGRSGFLLRQLARGRRSGSCSSSHGSCPASLCCIHGTCRWRGGLNPIEVSRPPRALWLGLFLNRLGAVQMSRKASVSRWASSGTCSTNWSTSCSWSSAPRYLRCYLCPSGTGSWSAAGVSSASPWRDHRAACARVIDLIVQTFFVVCCFIYDSKIKIMIS